MSVCRLQQGTGDWGRVGCERPHFGRDGVLPPHCPGRGVQRKVESSAMTIPPSLSDAETTRSLSLFSDSGEATQPRAVRGMAPSLGSAPPPFKLTIGMVGGAGRRAKEGRTKKRRKRTGIRCEPPSVTKPPSVTRHIRYEERSVATDGNSNFPPELNPQPRDGEKKGRVAPTYSL